jgi:hypothetical protein
VQELFDEQQKIKDNNYEKRIQKFIEDLESYVKLRH